MQIFKISRNYKNFARLIKIVSVIGKYGFSAFLSRIKVGLSALPEKIIHVKQEKSLLSFTAPQRIRLAIEELGPAFIKLGQVLSLRPDLIPPEYAKELEKLQDRTPLVGFKEILKVIECEFAESVDDVFSSIDMEPVASGSVAQVHRAVLRNSGQIVAVKVLKPRTREIFETDLSIISHLVRLAAHYIPELQAYNPIQIISEFTEILMNELNFIKEANTIERFTRFFRDMDGVHIPKIYRDYTTNSVMVMEFIDGIKVSNIEALEKAGMDRKKIAEKGAEISLRELFEFGFFHADPHPGNIFILPGNVVAPVDFGITGYIDEEGIQIIGNILFGLIERDADKVIRYLKRHNFIKEDVDVRKLKIDLLDFMDMARNTKISQINVSSSIGAIFDITRKYRIRFPSEYLLIFKTLFEVDGVARRLYPDYNFTESARPYMRRWFFDQYSPKRYAKDILILLDDINYFLKSIPTELSLIIQKVRFGRLKLPLVHENLEKAVSDIDRTGNRLSFSIIIASLLLSSAIIVQAKIGPFIKGYPVLGLAGFFTAAVMGILLLIGIIKSGRL
jgi:ubiquinone biosynthesis protein